MRAEILTIGDELCRGEIVDTNSAYLAGRLWDLGITTRWMTSCNDLDEDLAEAVSRAVARADVVVCSGGLGPTEDDLTVDVLARLAGVEPVIDEPSRARMERWFAGRVAVTPIQLRQVRVPAGARVYENPVGLAPGFEVEVGGVPVACVPGFPRELHAIWDRALGARLAELRETRGERERIARRIYRVFGRGESQISQACRGLIDELPGTSIPRGGLPAPRAEPAGPHPTVSLRESIHYQVRFPETLVKLVVRDREAAVAEARLAELDAEIRRRLAPQLYGTGDETLVERTTRRLIAAGHTVATAESCTGGMIGEMLTRLPGSSAAFRGGAIVYANDEKVRQLGVQPATLEAHGAVSEACVIEMARGCAERFGVDHAIAVSGVAGPGGGTPDKPVGTVWLALASAGRVVTRTLRWPNTRDQIRTLASWWALAMVDAAVPSDDPAEAARARWILEREAAP